MNLRVFDSAEELTRAAARTILQRVESGARSIALSGGSTPRPLYDFLSSQHADELAQHAITWVVVDERYVPMSDPQSNAAMIERTLFARGLPPSHRFLRFRTELGDPAATAREFEREWRELGLDTLDVVLLGCGDDGHTASLFPGTPVLDVEDRIASEVYVEKLTQWRVTLTKPVLRAAKLRLVLAAGASKAKIVREVREGAPHPVALATAGDELETWWLVDRAAAGKGTGAATA
ncbi:MAG: 6-phosphogluconolactonase [Acidobacteria bacterium]|nr:6-phosphogluconolactonase [Acidobacteriota bacterium]MBV9478705.1 6-phosphogluconolactonase [Acidobacteriota bacterium]